MRHYFIPLYVVMLIPAASAQVTNSTVDYFFDRSATIWDVADLRLENYFERMRLESLLEDHSPFVSVNYSFLDYDFDTGVPTIHFSIEIEDGSGDALPSLPRQMVEGMCESGMEFKLRMLRMKHADFFGRRGFSNKTLSEKLQQLEKQMKVEISYFGYDENDALETLSCTTTGYQKPIYKTWK